MNLFDKQATLGRGVFELAASTARRLFEVQQSGFQKYWETNQTFADKLSELKDPMSFIELQRQYGEAVWSGIAESLNENGQVWKTVAKDAGELLRDAWEVDSTAHQPEEAAKA